MSTHTTIAPHASDTRRPLFLIAGSAEAEDRATRLAAQFGDDVPVHGLPCVVPGDAQPTTVEGFASRLIAVIRRVQPRGPYRLAGGLAAYEVATQLIGQDEAVEFLGLVDTPCPSARHPATDAREKNYAVQRISMPVHVFASTGTDADALLGWDALLPSRQLHAEKVPQAQPDALARSLSDVLAQVGATARVAPEAAYQPEVTIQTGRAGGDAPLFCVPGAGDSVVGFAALATALGDTSPLHGLQPRGTDGDLVPHTSVRAAAAACVRAIERVHPRGALHLLGHSFGGWIVFEMAQQLRELGRPIASLTIVDSEAPEGPGASHDLPGGDHDATEVLARFIDVLELAAAKPLGVDPVVLGRLDAAEQRNQLHAAMVRVGLMPARSKSAVLTGPIRTFGTALRTRYRPPHIHDGPVRLVMVPDTRLDAASNQRQQVECLTGWRRWAPQTSPWVGPGNHMTILKEPHVRVLAQWWRNGLPSGAGR